MSTIYRRRPRRKSGGNHLLPILAASAILLALGCGVWFLYGKKFKAYFTPPAPITVYSDATANERLDKLMLSLSGSRDTLRDIAENWNTRVGWIKDAQTRRRLRWVLMERLIEVGDWARAMRILPEVEQLASMEQLDKLSLEAIRHNDFETQLHLDRALQEKAMAAPEKIRLLLRSIRRSTETYKRRGDNEAVFKTLAILDAQNVKDRLTQAIDASEAAALIMIRAKLSEVKEPDLQKVRNILEAANWPACPASSQLIIQEVANTIRDNPKLNDLTLREIRDKLVQSRDTIFNKSQENAELLPQCYMLLADVNARLRDYDGCAAALSMATALAEGYGIMNMPLRVKLTRQRLTADIARGAIPEALVSCRYLAENDPDASKRLESMLMLAEHATGEEQIKQLLACWDFMIKEPELSNTMAARRRDIATRLALHYMKTEDYAEAVKWHNSRLKLLEASNPQLVDGVVYTARIDTALAHRKNKEDSSAFRLLRGVVNAIDKLDKEQEEAFNKRNKGLYRRAVTELARTYLVTGDSSTARTIMKKVRGSLPNKVR